MRPLDRLKLLELQNKPERIRNICIMAHVDHGKTTLADSLVASNGVISQKMVGKLRYLDSRKDEQERGITMKSSSIALLHTDTINDDYLINLIDSPGHVDFSSEVSTAVRLCDGALIIVDVVEGVCAQTKVVLRQAWIEHIKPVLILNKIDRLITEMKLNPLDAYVRMMQLLEQVNAQVGELFAIDVMSKNENIVTSSSSGLQEADDSNLYFAPEQGNVVFASAADGWGFQIRDFSHMFSAKLGVSEEELQLTLWGDNYYNSKTRTIVPGAQENAKKPLFVQIVLENLWAIYESVVIRKDKEMTEKIVQKLQLKVAPRDLKHSDPKVQVQAILSQWLPLSHSVLGMVCEKLPSPLNMEDARAEKLMTSIAKTFDSLPSVTQALKKYFIACSSSDDGPIIAFVSKMTPMDQKSLPKFRARPLTEEDIALRRLQVRQKHAELIQLQASQSTNSSLDQSMEATSLSQRSFDVQEDSGPVFIGFARVFSGTLRKGQQLYVLGPKYDPSSMKDSIVEDNLTLKDLKYGQHVTRATIGELYILMGRELELVESAPAGSIIGIGGLEEHILKSATLSSTLDCPPFTELSYMAVPIVRVAVEPARPTEMPELIRGLRLLNQADPCVQVILQETGEHVLITAGEVHLQRCLQDLRETYARIEINASQPIVPFRETIISPPVPVGDGNDSGSVLITTPNKFFSMRIRATPLPEEVTTLLDKSVDVIRSIRQTPSARDPLESSLAEMQLQESLNVTMRNKVSFFRNQLDQALQKTGWGNSVDKILSFGPRRCGPNLLMYQSSLALPNVWSDSSNSDSEWSILNHSSSFINGFQLATLAGPLCEEPLMGVCFIVEELSINDPAGENDMNQSQLQSYGPLSGQIMSAVKEGCRKAFQSQAQRLMAAMYNCTIQVSGEVVGKMYGVLSRRHGRILEGDLEEGSASFSITALLPVVESFDLANEIRKQTSGLASLQLTFSHWEVIDTDPFWVPTTEEELELYGDKGDSVNRAQIYMNSVRRRKGLAVLEKVVEFAEKQRTLSRKV